MADSDKKRHALIRTAFAGILVFFLLQFVQGIEAMSWITRPAVSGLISIFGGSSSFDGVHFLVGKLRISWSRDCAGFNVLFILWGLILWTRRFHSAWFKTALLLVVAIPAAVVANIFRVLTIVAWRTLVYPAVESPQMHYFIGFLWLLPVLALFVPIRGRKVLTVIVETVMIAAVFSLVAPHMNAPGGSWVAVCALLLLAGQHWHPLDRRRERFLSVIWGLAGGAVALSSMESLWLPWLLLCPWTLPSSRLQTPSLLLLAASCIPVVTMHFVWVPVIGIIWAVLLYLRSVRTEGASFVSQPMALRPISSLCLLLVMPLPFVASTVGPVLTKVSRPPSGLIAYSVDSGAYLLHFAGQNPVLTITWQTANGTGRHHTLDVCMKYRGYDLERIESGSDEILIFTDGERWMSESFLLPGKGGCDYETYLKRTLLPFSSPGVHLIASAPKNQMSRASFERETRRSFDRIVHLVAMEEGGK